MPLQHWQVSGGQRRATEPQNVRIDQFDQFSYYSNLLKCWFSTAMLVRLPEGSRGWLVNSYPIPRFAQVHLSRFAGRYLQLCRQSRHAKLRPERWERERRSTGRRRIRRILENEMGISAWYVGIYIYIYMGWESTYIIVQCCTFNINVTASKQAYDYYHCNMLRPVTDWDKPSSTIAGCLRTVSTYSWFSTYSKLRI